MGKPFEIRKSPQVDAQFSIPYTVATAIIKRDVFIDDFFEKKIKTDNQVLQLAEEIKVVVDQKPIAKGLTPCVVEIKTRNGEVYAQRVEILRGDPRKPLEMEEIGQKFRKCAAFSARPISGENIEQVITSVSHLEDVENIAGVIELLG